MHERITELDELAADDAHKLGRTLATEVTNRQGEMSYDTPVSIYVEGLGTYVLRIESDNDSNPFDGNQGEYGELHWEANSGRHPAQRPSGVDGSGRKFDTRQGPVWWMPPADVKGEPDALEAMAERVRRFLAEQWGYVGVVLTLTHPHYADREGSLWGIETDGGAEYLAEVIDTLAADMPPAPLDPVWVVIRDVLLGPIEVDVFNNEAAAQAHYDKLRATHSDVLAPREESVAAEAWAPEVEA